MKQLLPLFLFLLPCLAWAQYPSNGNQKITLGEQTTADGLIWRGVASIDTVTATSKITRANKQDTSAFLLLDTVTNLLWHYKTASNGWSQAGGSTFDTTSIKYVNTYGTQTVNGAKTFTSALTGTSATFSATTGTVLNVLTTNDATDNVLLVRGDNGNNIGITVKGTGNVGIGTTSPVYKLDIFGTINTSLLALRSSTSPSSNDNVGIDFGVGNFNGNLSSRSSRILGFADGANDAIGLTFYTSNGAAPTEKMRITKTGNVGIGTASPQSGYRLHVVDSVYVGGNVSASAYTTRSDFNLKDDIFDLKYGLNEILNLQPVEYTYKSNGSKQLGFIAQDIGTILPEVVSFEESMSVNYQAIIPILTKAIQEQQALIKALEQRIINLENK
jgi:hypothetical protein